MIQLIAGSVAFHSTILKTKFDVQQVISSDSLYKILILNTMYAENECNRRRKQEIQGLSCVSNSICSKHPRIKNFVKEHVIDIEIWVQPLDAPLHLQSTAHIKRLFANPRHYVASIQSTMTRSGSGTARVEKKHLLMYVVWSSLSIRGESTCPWESIRRF